jgi:hypothetical protein
MSMFTVEIDWDEIAITVLDEDAYHEDVQCLIYDDTVYIRQWDDKSNRFSVVAMSPEMFDELRVSFDQGEGAYRRERIEYDENGEYDFDENDI